MVAIIKTQNSGYMFVYISQRFAGVNV